MKKAAYVGDHGRGGRGLDDCAVVLLGRYGCRSRQAARGPRRPWVNNPWCCLGSSPPTRERQGRKSVGSRSRGGKTAISVAGSHSMDRRKRFQGALVDGRRSASRMSLLLTRVRRNRRWLLESSGLPERRGATESVRGRSPAWHAADNAVARSPAHAELCSSLRGERWST
jgi:hypothetical protein